MGDFNVVLGCMDSSKPIRLKNDTGRATLLRIVSEGDMVDVWRSLNPRKRQYSRVQNLKPTGIDLLLASANIIKQISNIKYKINILGCKTSIRGGGSWYLNTSILNDEEFFKKDG